jgi:hypothetical protein
MTKHATQNEAEHEALGVRLKPIRRHNQSGSERAGWCKKHNTSLINQGATHFSCFIAHE